MSVCVNLMGSCHGPGRRSADNDIKSFEDLSVEPLIRRATCRLPNQSLIGNIQGEAMPGFSFTCLPNNRQM
jgi:hypothetical protein